MMRREYEVSKELTLVASEAPANGFYSLVMAAMRLADSENLAKLEAAFPEVWDELLARHEAPGGYLETDPDYEEYLKWRNSVVKQ